MKEYVYVALLRGINVGGKNIIKMAKLRELLTEVGFGHVQTYIASGNVVFTSASSSIDDITKKIIRALKREFDYTQPVLVLPAKEVKKILTSAPKEFRTTSKTHKYDVMFLFKPATPANVLKELSLREGVDQAWKGYKAVFFARKSSALTKSHLSKITALPVYKQMTIRNWNTSSKLLEMAEETKKKITA